jgi:hypothetical protein
MHVVTDFVMAALCNKFLYKFMKEERSQRIIAYIEVIRRRLLLIEKLTRPLGVICAVLALLTIEFMTVQCGFYNPHQFYSKRLRHYICSKRTSRPITHLKSLRTHTIILYHFNSRVFLAAIFVSLVITLHNTTESITFTRTTVQYRM